MIDTLSATHRFEQTAISPDGKKVAWVEDIITKRGVSTGDTVIYVAEIGGKNPPKRISAAVADALHAEGSVAWSPDSKKLAFLSDAAKAGQLQLYIMDAAGPSGSARKLTQVKGFLSTPGWSPSGKTIAVLFTENATRAAGPLVAETPETGEIKDSFFEQRLALVDVASGKLDQISPADTYIYEYDWSPDGLRFAVTAALGNGDNNWYIAELYTLDAATGLMKSIYKPPLQIANPAWSPDGKTHRLHRRPDERRAQRRRRHLHHRRDRRRSDQHHARHESLRKLARVDSATQILFSANTSTATPASPRSIPTDGTKTELFRDAGQITAGLGESISLSPATQNLPP